MRDRRAKPDTSEREKGRGEIDEAEEEEFIRSVNDFEKLARVGEGTYGVVCMYYSLSPLLSSHIIYFLFPSYHLTIIHYVYSTNNYSFQTKRGTKDQILLLH